MSKVLSTPCIRCINSFHVKMDPHRCMPYFLSKMVAIGPTSMGVSNFCWPVLLFYGSNYIEFKSKSKIFWTFWLFQNFLLEFSSSILFSFWFFVLIKRKWKNGFCKSLKQFTSYFFRFRCYSTSEYALIIPSSSHVHPVQKHVWQTLSSLCYSSSPQSWNKVDMPMV